MWHNQSGTKRSTNLLFCLWNTLCTKLNWERAERRRNIAYKFTEKNDDDDENNNRIYNPRSFSVDKTSRDKEYYDALLIFWTLGVVEKKQMWIFITDSIKKHIFSCNLRFFFRKNMKKETFLLFSMPPLPWAINQSVLVVFLLSQIIFYLNFPV